MGAPPSGSLGHEIIGAAEIAARVKALGEQISDDYRNRPPLLVGVLKGAFVFMADLARHICLPVEFDLLAVSSYGQSTRSSGAVRIVKDLEADIAGREVLLVEDIVDSGLTMSYLHRLLADRNPASLEVCALLVREGLSAGVEHIKYVGFEIPADFVVGYGLDAAEHYRGLGGIWVFDPA